MEPKPKPSVGFAELKAFLAKRRETSEQRREARYQTNDAVEVEILQTGFQRVAASIVDISRSGMCLLSEATIGKGSQVKITLEKHVVIFGEVQYCRPTSGGFHSGILIQDVFYPQRQAVKSKEKNGSRVDRRSEC
jgi:PilZ domain